MPTFSGKCSLVIAAVLCLSWSAASAQGEPVKYWIPFGPFGYGGSAVDVASAGTYGNFPSFDAARTDKSGFVFRSYSAPVNSLTGLGWSRIGGLSAFGSSLSYDSTQVGYNFKGMGDMPVTLFGGVDTLKYNPDVFNTITSFRPNDSTAPAYGVHAGVEIRPTSNLSLSLSAGYTQQQSGLGDGDISSNLLPRELGGRR
jgi:opacity protein-like surface antigen